MPYVTGSLASSDSMTPSPIGSPLLSFPPGGVPFSEHASNLKRRRTSDHSGVDSEGLSQQTGVWNASHQREFNEDLCKFLIANKVSWNTANNPETRLFFKKWIPGAVVPDRRTLSGPILDREAEKVEEKLKEKLKGKLGTYVTDGWKNKAKQSIVAGMVNVRSEVRSCPTPESSSIQLSTQHLIIFSLT